MAHPAIERALNEGDLEQAAYLEAYLAGGGDLDELEDDELEDDELVSLEDLEDDELEELEEDFEDPDDPDENEARLSAIADYYEGQIAGDP